MSCPTEKSRLLGINFGTARARLERDILYSLAIKLGLCICFRCGKFIDRDDFSVDHREHWSKAVNPKQSYFDINNIAFSHHRCNAGYTARRQEHGKGAYQRGCRCDVCKKANNKYAQPYSTEDRQRRYLKYGQ